MAIRSPYYDTIRLELARTGHITTDPRHVEAYMRLECGTLDHLSRQRFADEVAVGVRCIEEEGTDKAERCAQSFGL